MSLRMGCSVVSHRDHPPAQAVGCWRSHAAGGSAFLGMPRPDLAVCGGCTGAATPNGAPQLGW